MFQQTVKFTEVWHWSYMKSEKNGSTIYGDATTTVTTDKTLSDAQDLGNFLRKAHFEGEEESVVITSMTLLYSAEEEQE